MFLYNEVQKREANKEQVRVGLIGAGKFGSMFLSQAPFTIGLEVSSIVDISVENAKKNCRDVGWTKEQICLLYTSPSPRDTTASRMPSSA